MFCSFYFCLFVCLFELLACSFHLKEKKTTALDDLNYLAKMFWSSWIFLMELRHLSCIALVSSSLSNLLVLLVSIISIRIWLPQELRVRRKEVRKMVLGGQKKSFRGCIMPFYPTYFKIKRFGSEIKKWEANNFSKLLIRCPLDWVTGTF